MSYNTKDRTIECLRSVYEQTNVPFEVIVVDNASKDGSVEAIRSEFPDVRLYSFEKNRGFASANNFAADQANGDYLLLLNSDTVVLDGAIDKLIAFALANPSAGIWGGRTVFGDGSLNPTSCWRRQTLWSNFCISLGLSGAFPDNLIFNWEAYGGWQRDSVREVDIVTGCFFLIRMEAWKKLGGFSADFFMYGEEADLCLRAKKQLDFRPLITPEATIVHYGGRSEDVPTRKVHNVLAARAQLIRRHFPPWQRPVALAVFSLRPLRMILQSSLHPDPHARCQGRVWREVWRGRHRWMRGDFYDPGDYTPER